MSDLFTLRPAREGDWELINYYAYREGMDAIPSLENVTVAANGDDDCVGFCRLAFSEAGIAHVNPVVINEQWRGYGVGGRSSTMLERITMRFAWWRAGSQSSSIAFWDLSRYPGRYRPRCDGGMRRVPAHRGVRPASHGVEARGCVKAPGKANRETSAGLCHRRGGRAPCFSLG